MIRPTKRPTYASITRSAVVSPECAATPARRPSVSNLLRPRDPKQIENAARPLSGFIRDQIAKAKKQAVKPRRPLSAPPVDLSLWLDANRYAAWTMDGDLVSVEPPKPGFGAHRILRITRVESCNLRAVNRLIPTVISLYAGDELGDRPLTRFLADHRLLLALERALEKALAAEVQAAEPPPPARPAAKRGRKTRFRPEGSFIAYLPASPDQPDYVINTLDGLVPPAFESRRKAERFIAKHTRRGTLPEGMRVARVMASAKVRPVMRPGFRRPRSHEAFIELVRREPRVVLPELEVEWLPRYELCEDDRWRLQQFKLKRTVRHGRTRRILKEWQQARVVAARQIEELEIRHAVEPVRTIDEDVLGRVLDELRKHDWVNQQAMEGLEAQHGKQIKAARQTELLRQERAVLEPLARIDDLARRRLPAAWTEQLTNCGTPIDSTRGQARRPLVQREEGHWIRAPFESDDRNHKGQKSRILELKIEDLPQLLELQGGRIEFWMVCDKPAKALTWGLPASMAE